MIAAGDLTKRATLSSPILERDPDGNLLSGWKDEGTVWAHVLPLRGGEEVMQARMQSKAPAIVTVRASSLARQITAEWRVEIDGRSYDVKEPPRETQDRARLEFLAEG